MSHTIPLIVVNLLQYFNWAWKYCRDSLTVLYSSSLFYRWHGIISNGKFSFPFSLEFFSMESHAVILIPTIFFCFVPLERNAMQTRHQEFSCAHRPPRWQIQHWASLLDLIIVTTDADPEGPELIFTYRRADKVEKAPVWWAIYITQGRYLQPTS